MGSLEDFHQGYELLECRAGSLDWHPPRKNSNLKNNLFLDVMISFV